MKNNLLKFIACFGLGLPLLAIAYDLPVQWNINNMSNKAINITFMDSAHPDNTYALIPASSKLQVLHQFAATWPQGSSYRDTAFFHDSTVNCAVHAKFTTTYWVGVGAVIRNTPIVTGEMNHCVVTSEGKDGDTLLKINVNYLG